MLDFGLFAGVFAPDTDRKATGLRLGSESLLYKIPVPPDTPSPPILEFAGPCPGRMLLCFSLAMALLRSIFSTYWYNLCENCTTSWALTGSKSLI